MAAQAVTSALKCDVLCRLKDLLNFDQSIRTFPCIHSETRFVVCAVNSDRFRLGPFTIPSLFHFSHPGVVECWYGCADGDCVRLEMILSPEDPKIVRFADFVKSCWIPENGSQDSRFRLDWVGRNAAVLIGAVQIQKVDFAEPLNSFWHFWWFWHFLSKSAFLNPDRYRCFCWPPGSLKHALGTS